MNKNQKRAHYRQLFEASSLAWIFPISIGLGFGIGYWLDKVFGSWPWLSAIFSVFGILAAFINLFRIGLKNDVSGSDSKP